MGTIKLSTDSWVCKHCGSSVVREHPQEQCFLPGENPDRPGTWTARAERLANPDLQVCRIQHCLWITDQAWMTCDNCDLELSQEERQVVNGIMSKIDWSKVTMHEEIGIGVINDCAVARFPVEDAQKSPHIGKPMTEADYERLKGWNR